MGENNGELPSKLKWENMALAGAHPFVNPLSLSAVIQFSINCHLRSKRKRIGFPVVKLEFINLMQGNSCAGIRKMLKSYGVPAQIFDLQWEMLDDDLPVLRCQFLVPATQAEYADMILRWGEGGTYLVTSRQICKKIYYPGEPWGVSAKTLSWDEWVGELLFGWAGDRADVPKPALKELAERNKGKNIAAKGKATKAVQPKGVTKKKATRRKPKKSATVFGRGKELIGKIL